MRVKELFAFIHERHAIYRRKLAGQPKPWTKDPILQKYRFCNMYRELDTVTMWITKNWRQPYINDLNVWFAMAMARLINWPESLAAIGSPLPWDKEKFIRRLRARALKRQQVFTGAYMVRCDSGIDKITYLAERVLLPMWEQRKELNESYLSHNSATCFGLYMRLLEFYGLGSFMAAQIIADVKYTYLLCEAEDWHTFVAPGPGSLRGMNRVLGLPGRGLTIGAREEVCFTTNIAELMKEIKPLLRTAQMPAMHAQDLQNCLCEFDKYERTRLGEGRPRSTYLGI